MWLNSRKIHWFSRISTIDYWQFNVSFHQLAWSSISSTKNTSGLIIFLWSKYHESVFSPLNSVISGFYSLVLILHLFLVLRSPLHPFSQIQISSSVFLLFIVALVFAPVGTFNAPVQLTLLDNLVLLLVYLILFLIRLWYLRMHWFYRLHRFPSLFCLLRSHIFFQF